VVTRAREIRGERAIPLAIGATGPAHDVEQTSECAYLGRTQPRLSEIAGTAGRRSRDPTIGRCGRSGPDSLRGGAPRVLFFFYRSGLPGVIDSRFRVDGSPGDGFVSIGSGCFFFSCLLIRNRYRNSDRIWTKPPRQKRADRWENE
jgi:hypothetical protein